MLFFWTLYSSKSPVKNNCCFQKKIKNNNKAAVLNIDKIFFIIVDKISILEWFIKDYVTFNFAITGLNYILKYLKIDKLHFNCNTFSQYYYYYCIFD